MSILLLVIIDIIIEKVQLNNHQIAAWRDEDHDDDDEDGFQSSIWRWRVSWPKQRDIAVRVTVPATAGL